MSLVRSSFPLAAPKTPVREPEILGLSPADRLLRLGFGGSTRLRDGRAVDTARPDASKDIAASETRIIPSAGVKVP